MPDLKAKYDKKRATINWLMSLSPTFRASKLNTTGSQLSVNSRGSDRSRDSKVSSNARGAVEVKSPTKRKAQQKRESSSAKRKRVKDKLIAYYQSLVRPVDDWGPFYPE